MKHLGPLGPPLILFVIFAVIILSMVRSAAEAEGTYAKDGIFAHLSVGDSVVLTEKDGKIVVALTDDTPEQWKVITIRKEFITVETSTLRRSIPITSVYWVSNNIGER